MLQKPLKVLHARLRIDPSPGQELGSEPLIQSTPGQELSSEPLMCIPHVHRKALMLESIVSPEGVSI